ncbi:MAG TPA: hypothetical protein VHC70_07060 [Phycisphaerales bacterium]|nr:hypothetical protein [Phycisphaerales bacterium]
MAPGVATKVIAACFGLTAFAVAIVAGLFANNSAETTLIRALIAMVIAQAVGFVVGAIGERTINEALEASEKQAKNTQSAPAPRAPSENRAELSS